MNHHKYTNNSNSFINNSLSNDEDSQKIDLKEISENIFKLTEKRYRENIIDINKNEILELSTMNLKTIREKKYLYEDFIKFVYFYYNKYTIINSIANSEFSVREEKKQKLNKYEYSIQFSNIQLEIKNRKDHSFLNSVNQFYRDNRLKTENNEELISLSSKSSEEENIIINDNKSNEIENNSKQNDIEISNEEKHLFLEKKRKMENIKNKKPIYEQIKNNNISKSQLNETENNKFNQNNIEFKFKPKFNTYENDSIMILDKKLKEDININLENKREKNNYTEEKPSKNLLITISNDKEYNEFKKDLVDYLLKIIGEKRKKKLFDKLLPESVDIMKKLFKKDNGILPNTRIPIYRNDYLEFSLIIENRGKIEIKILYIKE